MTDERDILLPEGFLWVRSPADAPNGSITCTTCHASTHAHHKESTRVKAFTNFHEAIHAPTP